MQENKCILVVEEIVQVRSFDGTLWGDSGQKCQPYTEIAFSNGERKFVSSGVPVVGG